MVIHNYIERMVWNLLPEIMSNANMCQCEQCQVDVVAMSLNNIKPKYVVSEKGALYAKLNALEAQNEADVITQMAKACAIVKTKPRHS